MMNSTRLSGQSNASLPTLLDIRAEKARRARRDLRRYIPMAWPLVEAQPFVPGWHIDAIADHLKAVSAGQIRRLIINEPPRHMKSLTCNVFWPTWDWIEQPWRQFLFASYRAALSARDNIRARRILTSPWYMTHYAPRLSQDQNTRMDIANTDGGRRLVSSVGGTSSTGEGADIIIVDDPISADAARSQVERQGVIDWWEETMRSRLNDPATGAMIIVMQRLHEQDLTGHLLATDSGWDHLCLPARYEPDHPTPLRSSIGFTDPRREAGELLWPARFDAAGYNAVAAEGSYVDAGQLQQRPAPRAGGMFSRDDFAIIDALPDVDRWTRGWDLAGSVDGNWSVGCLMGRRRDGAGVVIKHVMRFRERPGGVERRIVNTAIADDLAAPTRIVLPRDPGQAGVAQQERYAKLLEGRDVRFEAQVRDKEARAMGLSAQCEIGRVFLLRGPWVDPFVDELAMFPRGVNDDQVDAAATAFNDLSHGLTHKFW